MFPVEVFRDTLAKAVAIFQRHSIRFHLTGGVTAVAYGEPRMTQDIDIVIDNSMISSELEGFILSVAHSDFFADPSTIRDAIARQGMFQMLDMTEALKLDIYPRELIRGELDRSQMMEVFEGMCLPVAAKADAAASKLIWINKGSHKSRRDLRHIYRNASALDRRRIRELADQLTLTPLLDEVLSESDEILE